MERTNDIRILSCELLQPPAELKKDFPISEESAATVVAGRRQTEAIIAGKDHRAIFVVGPCSIHDPAAAMDYAHRLVRLREKVQDRILLVMRVYFEKPRTTIGWRGLVLDPAMNGTGDINLGLRLARKLLLDITALGMPAGSEVLDPIVPQYIADLISWASIGARTIESQTHREMASGLSMPVGFKNGTDGSLETAINAMQSSITAHSFIGIDQEGRTSVLKTTGNPYVHLILRGGKFGPNYYEESIEKAVELLEKAKVPAAVIVDTSHANSGKMHTRQSRVLQSFLDQRFRGRDALKGVMLESNLVEGCQAPNPDFSKLVYGQSVTDACIGWEETEALILEAWAQLGKQK